MLARHVQIVLFTAEGASLDASEIWSRLIGSSPDAFNRVRGVVPSSQASGLASSYHIKLTTQPGRVDIYGYGLSENGTASIIPDFQSALKYLTDINNFAFEFFNCHRLAIVVPFVKYHSSEDEAKMELKAKVPFLPIDPNGIDYVFQVNQKRESNSNRGLMINRIRTWGVHLEQSLVIDATGQALSSAIRPALGFQIDVNSDASHTALLSLSDARELLSELVGEIASCSEGRYDAISI